MNASERVRRCQQLIDGLGRPRAALWITCIALLLSSASVGPHLVLDDSVLKLIAVGEPPIPGLRQDQFDLFTFTTGDPSDNRKLMNQGIMLPWWTLPELRISFYRPLASATHQLDFALWPDSAIVMHLHSLLWFGVMLFAVWRVYVRLEAPSTLGLSYLIYALDDAHGPAISWISNRNSLIAVALSCSVLLMHDRARRDGVSWARLAAPVLLLIALLAGEFSLGVGAYLLAYACFVDSASARSRILSLVPYAGAVTVWRIGYQAAGHGAFGSGAYVDPGRQFGEFLAVLPEKIALLLHGQLSAPPSDLAFIGPPAHRPLLVALALGTVVVFGWLLWPIVRKDRLARFWALGTFVSCLPLVASFPSDRLLLFVGLGAAPLIGRLILAGLSGLVAGDRQWVRQMAIVLVGALHLVAAPILLPFRARQMEFLGSANERARALLPGAEPLRPWVLLNAPIDILASYVTAERAARGQDRPSAWNWLATASSPLTFERVSEGQIRVTPEQGFLYSPLERHYRGDRASLPVGSRISLSSFDAEVIRVTEDGRPASVLFTLGAPAATYAFYQWDDDRYAPIELPPVGARWTLPAADFGEIVLRAALRDFGILDP